MIKPSQFIPVFTDWFIECWVNLPYFSEAGLFYKEHPQVVEVDYMIIIL